MNAFAQNCFSYSMVFIIEFKFITSVTPLESRDTLMYSRVEHRYPLGYIFYFIITISFKMNTLI